MGLAIFELRSRGVQPQPADDSSGNWRLPIHSPKQTNLRKGPRRRKAGEERTEFGFRRVRSLRGSKPVPRERVRRQTGPRVTCERVWELPFRRFRLSLYADRGKVQRLSGLSTCTALVIATRA